MSAHVRGSYIFVECHRACNRNEISDYAYNISYEGDYILDGRQLTAAELQELRDCIDAALKMTGKEKGGEHESD